MQAKPKLLRNDKDLSFGISLGFFIWKGGCSLHASQKSI